MPAPTPISNHTHSCLCLRREAERARQAELRVQAKEQLAALQAEAAEAAEEAKEAAAEVK